MNLNEVRLIGGLTRDPEVKAVGASMTTLVELSMALNGTRYDSAERKQVVKTTFVTVQAWGWLAERVISMMLARGDEVYVLGELDQTEVEKPDGTKDRKTRVTAAIIEATRSRSPSASPGAQSRAAPARNPRVNEDPYAGLPPMTDPPF